MLIRHPIISPSTGHRVIKEIHINIEEIRSPHSATPMTQPGLVATCDGLTELADPSYVISSLLDSKRTYLPPGCLRSRLSKDWNGHSEVEVMDDNLEVELGDPVAVMSGLGGEDVSFFIVEKIDGNRLNLIGSNRRPYLAGSFVQNLKNKIDKKSGMGICAKIERPEPIPFVATPEDGIIHVSVSRPMNRCNIVCYDVYVRNSKFKEVEPHWFPDLSDIDIDEKDVSVKTAEGKSLVQGGTYFMTVITKDATGFVNVNESPATYVEIVHT